MSQTIQEAVTSNIHEIKEVIQETPMPGLPPALNSHLNDLWTLYYRHGNVPNLKKIFRLKGTIQDASLRGRQHCLLMRYTFIFVRPLIIDLDAEEEQKKNRPETYVENYVK